MCTNSEARKRAEEQEIEDAKQRHPSMAMDEKVVALFDRAGRLAP